jgi:hypothetical protein
MWSQEQIVAALALLERIAVALETIAAKRMIIIDVEKQS